MAGDDDTDPVELDGTHIDETPKGVKIDTAKGPMWFPKQYVTWSGDGKAFTIPEWLATERGLV